MPLLVDTGILYALADQDDAWHHRAREWLKNCSELLLVPIAVVPEVSYLLRTRLGPRAELSFAQSLAKEELAVQGLNAADFRRIAALLKQYTDIGFVDASIVAIAERINIRTLATTDRRHFSKIRPLHVPTFALVP